jgi:hypothetical protein
MAIVCNGIQLQAMGSGGLRKFAGIFERMAPLFGRSRTHVANLTLRGAFYDQSRKDES